MGKILDFIRSIEPHSTPVDQTLPEPKPDATPLQNHVAFFDINGDGVITIDEAAKRLRLLGLGKFGAEVVAVPSAIGISAMTHSTPFTTRTDTITEGKGKATTWVFDAQGKLDPARFEQIFDYYAGAKGYLDQNDVDQIAIDRSQPKTGERFRSLLQFNFLLTLGGETNANGERVLTRERMQSFYKGTLFFDIAKANALVSPTAVQHDKNAFAVLKHIWEHMNTPSGKSW